MSPRAKKSPGRREEAGLRKGRIKVRDPFELIRWLALSQTDPRKALAELVQNSLDAGARSIEITRERIKGVPCLRIRDDGEGVIPELERPDALRFIATNIGHSRKRSLTPSERLELMTQGQYGIGLLGFWCLGETLELRSSIEGQRPHRLILTRDRPDYGIEPLRGRIAFDDQRWTEVVVVGLHRDAMPALVAGRAAEYLAAELRGQLLMRDVSLEIHDRMTRGTGQKRVTVRPKRFLGERIDLPPRLELPGHPPLQLEIYLRGDDTDGVAPGIGVYAAGTLVAEDFHAFAALGLDHPPWTDSRLTGLVDFPALAVAPGSRRGVIPDAAAARFAAALRQVEPDLAGALERFDRRRAEALDSAVIRDLQRAFRDFYRQRPSYRMLPVDHKEDAASGPPGHSAARASAAVGSGADTESAGASGETALGELDHHEASEEPRSLFPPGPLTEVRIVPSTIRIERGGRRQVRARPLDEAGRRVVGEVRYQWRLEGEVGRIEGSGEPPLPADGERIVLAAATLPAAGSLTVTAVSGSRAARAEASVEVVEELNSSGGRSDEGIPEPELVDEPGARWRSRMIGGAWQVNSGHPEFRLIADRPSLKLKYLALLFAKEIVLLSTHDPRLEAPLEQMVEVAAYADRKLDERRPGRRGRSKSAAD